MRIYEKVIFSRKIFFLLILVLIDQLSKYIIRVSGGFYICNPNIAFGIKVPEILFFVLWIFIVFIIGTILYKKYFIHDTLYTILILSGALSNLIDRIFFGCIIDFINLKIWLVFNLADVYITIGAIIIIKHITYNIKQKKN